MKYILMCAAALVLTACGNDEKSVKEEITAEQRADNPLLRAQDNTVKKAEDAVNTAAQKQQEALDKISQ